MIHYATGEPKANRNHKDSVFTRLFGEKNNLLELYNAISGKNYPEGTEIKIITLSNVLFMEQLNDICFVIDNKLVVLVEHQSTINENMPLRMLQYIVREYEIKENQKNMKLPEAIKLAVKSCINKNILVSFLREHSAEIDNMLLTEWNMEDALAVKLEEGIAIGQENKEKEKEEAWEGGREEVFALLRQGYSLDEAEKMLRRKRE